MKHPLLASFLLIVIAISPSFAQGPGGVSANLKAWYKGNVGTSGTAPVVLWNNQSPTIGIDALAVNGPTLLYKSINYNSALSFDGNNDIMRVPTGLLGTSTVDDVFVYIVSNAQVSTAGRTIFGENVSGERFQAHIPWADEVYWDFGACCGTGRVNTLTGWGATSNKYYSWALGSSTGTATPSGLRKSIYRDGLLIASSNSQDGVVGNNNPFDIGGNNGGEFYFGSIAELIVYTGVPSNTEFQKIQSYLAIKYGLMMDQTVPTDYISSSNATIYDADGSSSVAGYNNDIAGIGRDDASQLDQRRSMSSTGNDALIMSNGIPFGSSFANNNSFVVWGNDGNTLSSTSVNLPPGYLSRSARIWKTDALGTLGSISVRFLLNGGIINSGDPTNYALAVDNDSNFGTGATLYTTATLSGDTLTFSGVTFPVGSSFLTLAANIAPRPYPGGVAGNYLIWFRSDREVTGVSPVTGWGDQSIRNRDAVASNGPTFVDPRINFNPSLQFNGTSNFVEVTSGLFGASTYNSAFTYAVASTNTIADRNFFYEQLAGSANDRFSAHLPWSDSNVYYDFGTCCIEGRVNGNWGATVNEFNYWTMGSSTSTATPSGTRRFIYRNNTLTAANNNIDTGTGANSPFTLGSAGFANYYIGEVSEFFVSTNIPSLTELAQIHSYLSIKYGMHKPGNYLASDGSVIWDATTNSTYHNDVTAIGRDDNSDLLQKQSKSYNSDDIITIGAGPALTATNALNTGTFGGDKSFLVWGNNNGSISSNGGVDLPATILRRLQRAWKVVETGTSPPGTVRIRFETTVIPGTNDLQYVRLLVDDDGTFATGATLINPSFYDNTAKIVEFTHDFVMGTGYFFTLGSVNIAGAPLPVQLLSFTATPEKSAVQLAWSTETETRNNLFTIERAASDLKWEPVVTVQGAGNSNAKKDYAATDNRPFNGISFYRLKQTDFDGVSSYSKIVKVEINLGDQQLVIYPNPTKGDATLVIPSTVEVERVELFTSLGLKLNSISSVKSNGEVSIEMNSLPKGIYLVRVTGKNGYQKSVRLAVE
ncbi:MAG: T9SS type A sorting domain-containing protein [Cyclobacteriaceae bacterium]|nr:T9SS type A sorting domain-containing protein [Cyclobacteriaceae bacterium]